MKLRILILRYVQFKLFVINSTTGLLAINNEVRRLKSAVRVWDAPLFHGILRPNCGTKTVLAVMACGCIR